MASASASERINRNDEDDDEESAVAFASVDFTGVDFDSPTYTAETDNKVASTSCEEDEAVLEFERALAFGEIATINLDDDSKLQQLGELLDHGKYAEILRSDVAKDFFSLESSTSLPTTSDPLDGHSPNHHIATNIRQQVYSKGTSLLACVEIEILGIAALNLFLQANYTGPALSNDDAHNCLEPLADINPHACWKHRIPSTQRSNTLVEEYKSEEIEEQLTQTRRLSNYQNAILSELAVEGEWPCQVCSVPYFLLLARSILLSLADPSRPDWMHSRELPHAEQNRDAMSSSEIMMIKPPMDFLRYSRQLCAVHLWSARAAVVHKRLIPSREIIPTLWSEAESMLEASVQTFCSSAETPSSLRAATVWLEYGLAESHFERPGKGKQKFRKAQECSGLVVEVTGSEGKRTKFQKKATAQYLVKARSTTTNADQLNESPTKRNDDSIKDQMIKHSEDEILLEKIKFEDDKENEVLHLNILDQAIILALCLDVKNNNPADGLTAEEMGAFLARVLDHHDDWMVYSTALLERAWLEFERSHGRERAILQIQALVDQHTERLTITQSTRKSIEESAPVQDRLKMLHTIVYPPRWSMIADLADRYANLGIVTSAAELYTEVEMWDDVVDCYRRAGKIPLAEKIVRERLHHQETPRMWSALGDLTGDPEYYEKAIALSNGRYAAAFVSLGAHNFDKGDLPAAFENYSAAVKVRPLFPQVWFRLGTVCMQLGRWEAALRAFSEVVQQEPEEADAWANIAAVHMHNKQPAKAYPALVESLKYARSNWRVWVSKLYTCLDLQKYDEALQACNMLLDLRLQRQAADDIPPLEEKCVRAIVGGALKTFHECQDDEAAKQGNRRTLTRVGELLVRLTSSSDAEPWMFETFTFFHEHVGQDKEVMDTLMKEYRALQTIQGWEKDDYQVRRVCAVVAHIAHLQMREGSSESISKAKLMVRGILKKVSVARPDDASVQDEIKLLEKLLKDIETASHSLGK